MSNRDRHRQGLIYGPVRPNGPRDRGRIVGNLLGLLVVAVTVGVLGLAIYFFIQQRASEPPPPPPTATPVASVDASPSASPVIAASPTPVPLLTFAPLPTAGVPTTPPPSVPSIELPSGEPTPGPTDFVPAVMEGPGFVTFGTNADAQLHVTDAKATFGIDEPMVWSAYLTQTANSADLKIRILKLDPSQPTGQLLIREDPVLPDVTGAQIFFRRLRPLGTTSGAGLYTVEYVQGDQILATGSFMVQ